jgi:hypothetical protein
MVRRRAHLASFIFVAPAVAVLAAPGTLPAPPPARPRPQGAPHLAWVSDWNGSPPTLFASAGGQLAIAAIGNATLGAGASPTGSPLRLSLIRFGADRRPGRPVGVAPGLAWAQPLALLDDGGLVIDGPPAGAATPALMRTRADGSIAWAQPLPAGTYAGAAAADLRADTVAVVVATGVVSADAKGYFPVKSNDDSAEELRSYDAGGQLRFSSRLASSRRIGTRTIALLRSGGLLVAGGRFSGDLRIDGGGAPPVSASHPGPADTAWIASWDAGGRVSWLRTFAGPSPWLEAISPLADGSVLALGWCYGRLTNMDGVDDVGGGDAGHGDTGAPNPNRQRSFLVRLDGATGAPLSIEYVDGTRATSPLADGLIEVATSDRRDGERTYVTTLSATDAAGDNRWRATLDAQVAGVAAASDAVLVWGSYNAVMTLPGREPPAVLTGAGSNRTFVGLLAWQGDAAAAPPSARAADNLHAQAMRAFRGKRYRQACDLFVAAQVARPANAANMTDLALCLERAGDKEAAARANRYAIRLAEAPGVVDEDKGRRRVRKAAYYNLGRLNPGGWQRALVPDFDCTRKVFADTRTGRTGGVRYLADFEVARFALDAETAALDADEYKLEWPDLGADDSATDDAGGTMSYDVTLSLEEDFRDSQGDTQETSSAGCQLVHSDGCSGHLGFSCAFAPRGEDKARTRAIELTLTPAPPAATP